MSFFHNSDNGKNKCLFHNKSKILDKIPLNALIAKFVYKELIINNCLICKKEKVTKTNLHLIPSFIIAKVCSYDGSEKRNKEIMFTMTSYKDKLYVGTIPDTKLDELFNQKKVNR